MNTPVPAVIGKWHAASCRTWAAAPIFADVVVRRLRVGSARRRGGLDTLIGSMAARQRSFGPAWLKGISPMQVRPAPQLAQLMVPSTSLIAVTSTCALAGSLISVCNKPGAAGVLCCSVMPLQVRQRIAEVEELRREAVLAAKFACYVVT